MIGVERHHDRKATLQAANKRLSRLIAVLTLADLDFSFIGEIVSERRCVLQTGPAGSSHPMLALILSMDSRTFTISIARLATIPKNSVLTPEVSSITKCSLLEQVCAWCAIGKEMPNAGRHDQRSRSGG